MDVKPILSVTDYDLAIKKKEEKKEEIYKGGIWMHALYILYAHDSLKVGTISQFVAA